VVFELRGGGFGAESPCSGEAGYQPGNTAKYLNWIRKRSNNDNSRAEWYAVKENDLGV
jgi:hypothetical protein